MQRELFDQGWPGGELGFDPQLMIPGPILDLQLGNVLKANRFGYIKRAYHGTRQMDFEEQRAMYARTIVDLAEDRWVFLNTLFTLSEGCMYAQLVDLLDRRELPDVVGYDGLYRRGGTALDEGDVGGRPKGGVFGGPGALGGRGARPAQAGARPAGRRRLSWRQRLAGGGPPGRVGRPDPVRGGSSPRRRPRVQEPVALADRHCAA